MGIILPLFFFLLLLLFVANRPFKRRIFCWSLTFLCRFHQCAIKTKYTPRCIVKHIKINMYRYLQRITKFFFIQSSTNSPWCNSFYYFIFRSSQDLFSYIYFFSCVLSNMKHVPFISPILSLDLLLLFSRKSFIQFFIDLQHTTNSIPIIFLLSEIFLFFLLKNIK